MTPARPWIANSGWRSLARPSHASPDAAPEAVTIPREAPAKCQILRISVAQLVAVWPQVEPHLRRALAYCQNCWEPVDILAELMRGEAELWVAWQPQVGTEAASVPAPQAASVPAPQAAAVPAPQAAAVPRDSEVLAAMVTRIISYPRRKSCQIFLIGGRSLSLWSESFLTTIEAYARSHGCHLLEGGARLGWSRVGSFRKVGVTLIKEIHYG